MVAPPARSYPDRILDRSRGRWARPVEQLGVVGTARNCPRGICSGILIDVRSGPQEKIIDFVRFEPKHAILSRKPDLIPFDLLNVLPKIFFGFHLISGLNETF